LRAKIKSTQASHHRFAKTFRRFLCNGFNGLFRALPGEPGLLSPSPRNAKHCRELTPASGRQDHTASPSARNVVRLATLLRPPHPAPNVRDDRDTPLFSGAGWREVIKMICPTAKAKKPAADWHDGQITSSFRKPRSGYPESICQDD
jgi:hypothetical protein